VSGFKSAPPLPPLPPVIGQVLPGGAAARGGV